MALENQVYKGIKVIAGIAQLVEQLICNQPVVGSSPTAGSMRDLQDNYRTNYREVTGHAFSVFRLKYSNGIVDFQLQARVSLSPTLESHYLEFYSHFQCGIFLRAAECLMAYQYLLC